MTTYEIRSSIKGTNVRMIENADSEQLAWSIAATRLREGRTVDVFPSMWHPEGPMSLMVEGDLGLREEPVNTDIVRVTHKIEIVDTDTSEANVVERFELPSVGHARAAVGFLAGRMNPEASLRIERTTTTVEVIS